MESLEVRGRLKLRWVKAHLLQLSADVCKLRNVEVRDIDLLSLW